MKSVIVKPDNIELTAGAVVKILGTWQDYQTLLQQLGDRTSPLIKYRNGEFLQDAYQFGSEAIDKLSDRFPRRR